MSNPPTNPLKPTIVLVPGAWHKPLIYSAVATHLTTHAYPTILLPLPSAGASPPHKDFSHDVAAIRDCLETLIVREEKDVVLVVHSYANLPGSEAAEGLGKRERERGGVVRFVVVNGLVVPEGFACVQDGKFEAFPEWMRWDVEKGIVTVTPSDAKKIFYNDLPDAEAERLIPELVPQSLGVYTSTTTYAAWRKIPSTFLAGDLDQSSVTPQMVEMMIKGAQQVAPDAFDVVERCREGGHCLMVSQPEWMCDALRRAAGEEF